MTPERELTDEQRQRALEGIARLVQLYRVRYNLASDDEAIARITAEFERWHEQFNTQ